MVQITRVFDNAGRAKAALDELKAQGFSDAELTPLAEQRGRSVLRVEAPFGSGLKVEAILDRHAKGDVARSANGGAPAAPQATTATPAPAASPASEPQAAARVQATSAPAAPTKDAAASTRNGSHGGVRSGPRTLSQWLGIPELIDSDTFFSGFPLLIRPTPKLTGETTKRS